MGEKEIPIPYKVILKRFWKNADMDGKIPIRKAKIILSNIYRMEKENISNIIVEMRCQGFIQDCNHLFFKLAVPYDQLV